jgi:putative oxidoreductase
MKIGRLLLSVAVGGSFIGHGTQKLFGWFGANGLQATAESFEQLGCAPVVPTRSRPQQPRQAEAR